MALRIHLFSTDPLPQPLKLQTCPLPYPSTTITNTNFFTTKTQIIQTQISCRNNILSDAVLASDLATEVARMNTQLVQREEAMKKSRELLFTEFCHYLALEQEEVKRKWKGMDEEEKWVLVKGFVSEWGVGFHPLSARSVKEMVDEYLHENKLSPPTSFLFPGLKSIMGFSQNKE
ncbi:hypothetical protein CFOL_v3_08619 [Cephalotus follicularis]|uniref:DUF7026 domain-containing protein n=1 Tax=Cephalotus follicularis TaxID=3775 RepID=A0A1Q3BB90_CEPFO|nr:hypothetical protein CFOL_v3_08619 [Cephalotus follicularis]